MTPWFPSSLSSIWKEATVQRYQGQRLLASSIVPGYLACLIAWSCTPRHYCTAQALLQCRRRPAAGLLRTLFFHCISPGCPRLTEVVFTFGLTGSPGVLQTVRPSQLCCSQRLLSAETSFWTLLSTGCAARLHCATGLDALAHHWHLSGVPAQSLQWGPWLEAGMAAGSLEKGSGRSKGAGLCCSAPAFQGSKQFFSPAQDGGYQQ